jgi:parvulin-like peptidyl-prolyl isomerase
MRITKILWLAVPIVFLVVFGMAVWGPGPKPKPEVRVRVIATKANPSDPQDVERARKKIEEAYEHLKKGAKFSQVAGTLSEAESKSDDGDMGWTGRGVLPQHLEDVVFKLEPGQYSEIIQDYAGEQLVYRILYVEQRRNF